MREPPTGLYRAFQRMEQTATLGASGAEPFNARKHIDDHPEQFFIKDQFNRSIRHRLFLCGHPDIVHAQVFDTVKSGARLHQVPELLGTHRVLLPMHALELLVREENEPTGVFSYVHLNYVRASARVWMLLKFDRGRWHLDARTRGMLEESVPLGSRIIVRN